MALLGSQGIVVKFTAAIFFCTVDWRYLTRGSGCELDESSLQLSSNYSAGSSEMRRRAHINRREPERSNESEGLIKLHIIVRSYNRNPTQYTDFFSFFFF